VQQADKATGDADQSVIGSQMQSRLLVASLRPVRGASLAKRVVWGKFVRFNFSDTTTTPTHPFFH